MKMHTSTPCVSKDNDRESAVRWLIVNFGLTHEAAELTLDAADWNGRCGHVSGFEVAAVPTGHFDRDGEAICRYDMTG